MDDYRVSSFAPAASCQDEPQTWKAKRCYPWLTLPWANVFKKVCGYGNNKLNNEIEMTANNRRTWVYKTSVFDDLLQKRAREVACKKSSIAGSWNITPPHDSLFLSINFTPIFGLPLRRSTISQFNDLESGGLDFLLAKQTLAESWKLLRIKKFTCAPFASLSYRLYKST
jgi:hypothetical protein